MQKAPDAFRTISEAAEMLDVPQHVLRFWETRFSQIRPMKRAGGRRYYRPQDIDLLRGIRRLLYDEGYTIKGVQKILREHGMAHVIAIGRGELVVMPAGGAAALPQASAPAPATQGQSNGPAGANANAGTGGNAGANAKVTALKPPGQGQGGNGASADAARLRRELQAALRELEEARALLQQALGEEQAPDAGGAADNAAPRQGGGAA